MHNLVSNEYTSPSPGSFTPDISLSPLKAHAIGSIYRMSIRGAIGNPCLQDRDIGTYFERNPFVLIHVFAPLSNILIHPLKISQN
jgi:hypothetical protein